MKFRKGDLVEWNGSPNEFGNNRYGYILSIKKGIAKITHPYCNTLNLDEYTGKTRLVPVNILKLRYNKTHNLKT